jgi:hypothetical protein
MMSALKNEDFVTDKVRSNNYINIDSKRLGYSSRTTQQRIELIKGRAFRRDRFINSLTLRMLEG